MSIDQRLAKVYSDQNYKFTTIVRHQGVVIAFAMDQGRHIYYSVLDPRETKEGDGRTDADFWATDPRALRFPTEITEVGYSAAGNAVMPVVALGGRVEAGDTPLFPEEMDPFLSSTARLTADCPFCAYSDGAHVFLFRQAIAAAHPDAVLRLQSGQTSGDAGRKDLLHDAAGAPVPIASASLLCDRFVFVGGQLQPTAEVRFRRSRHKTMPDSAKDSLGPQDMNGNFFQEPTQHLSLVRNLKDGCFCVLQVPTGMPDVKYWQVFAYNSRTQRMDSFNIERGADGLFNTQGTQGYTSPDPQYQTSVYEREPGLCPFTQKELVPIVSEEGFAETGVLLDGATGRLTLPDAPAAALAGAPFTIEAWIRADEIGPVERALLTKARKDGSAGFALYLDAQGQPGVRGANGGAAVTSPAPIDDRGASRFAIKAGEWTHLAAIFDGRTLRLLVNGETDGSAGVPALAEAGSPIVVGAGLKGMIDEVRLWGRARVADEIRRDRGTSLVGQETGLVAYYRCDEGQGAVVHDQTDNAKNGTLQGATWGTSDARVGNHPGVRRDSFHFTGRTIASPPAALLYNQQERSGPRDSLLKRQARVLLTCALAGPGPDGQQTDNHHVAALDFAVARDGSLAQVPDEVGLEFINTAVQGATLDEISKVEQEITRLKADAARYDSNTALSFNGISDGASFGNKQPFNHSDFTVEFWMKRPELNRDDYALCLGEAATDKGLCIGFSASNYFRFVFWWDDLDTPQVYLDTDWHHWACTFNRTTRRRVIYRDGVQVATDTARGVFAGAGDLWMCMWTLYRPGNAKCLLDEVRIWGRERGAKEIQADLNRHLVGNEAGLLACYTFAGRGLRDRTGHGNDGTVIGGSPTVAASILQSSPPADQVKKLEDLQTQLANMTGGLRGGDIAVPVPLLAIDRAGLTIMGGLLGFAYSDHRPVLLDSTTGDVVLYYRGQNGLFYAAYYDTIVSRHALALQAGAQPLRLIARSAGLDLAQSTVTVSDGKSAELCTVLIGTPRLMETWPDVPRDPQRFAGVLNGLAEDYEYRKATCSVAGGDLSRGSLIFAASERGATAPVQNGPATAAGLAATTRFWSDAPGRALRFDGQADYLTLPAAQLAQAEVTGPATVEAWVNAAGVKQRARILHANTGGSQYTLGLEGAQSQDALAFDGSSDRVSLGAKIQLKDTSFTIEIWMKRQQTDRDDYVIGQGRVVNNQGLVIGIGSTNQVRLVFWGNDLNGPAFSDTDWHHWAFLYNKTTLQRTIYRDGVPVANDTASSAFAGTGDLLLGHWFSGDPSRCLLDEVRIWGRERTQQEIQADLSRRLQGDEAGLLAYYTFAGRDLRDRTGRGNDGKVTSGNPAVATSVLATRTYQVFAGVGPNFVRTRDTLPGDGWSHLAASFNQSWALQFNGSSNWLNGGTEEGLNLGDEVTVEVFCQISAIGRPAGILSKGRLADGTGQRVPYQLAVAPDGKVVFAFESGSGAQVALTSTQALQPGVFYRIAAVRQNCRAMSGQGIESWQELSLYFNGSKAGTLRYDGDSAGSHTGALEIGRACAGRQERYFPGIISEVRLWSAAREARDLGRALTGRERDLVARWAFQENRGNITRDVAGGREARIYGARWTKNPDPSGSALTVYVNGVTVATELVPAGAPLITAGPGDPQFTLGAMLKDGKPQDTLCGVLEEVRVWRTRRTAAEIMDNLFTRLRGERQDLLAYYTFDDNSTLPDSTRLRDDGPRGNHLPYGDQSTRPDVVLSTAPVSNDTAQVRGALGGVRTAFHESIDCEPAVAEYGVLQDDAGAMKRCYSTIKNGTWQIISGYKVGDLVTEWVGQAQFDPQVIGYVEGAPPVPAENLVAGPLDPDGDGPSGITSLSFTQADEVTSSLSSSSQASIKAGLELSAELKAGFESSLVIAPFGIGESVPLKITVSANVKAALEFENSWSSENQMSQGSNTGKALTVALTGYWQDKVQAQTALGRRFQPSNTGFALVQSATADVFALRLAHTGALVSYRMRPNADIPRDWNLIPFPINPFYVKQGTLDGCAGITEEGAKLLDESYPQAAGYGEYSYFKPREAYALKRQIARDQQRAQVRFAGASVNPFEAQSPLLREAMAALGPAAGEGTEKSADASLQRSIANTYVWTAEGGFFAESTETVDSFTESTSGSYSFSASMSAGVGVEIEAGVFNMSVQCEATFGGGFNETRTRTREASRSFGVEVACNVPGDLQRFDADGNPLFDEQHRPKRAAGRVDGYRFMTFLLAASGNHYDDLFSKVVDPTWLKESNHPSAIALRQARQADKRPPCWRIMHRVTYVSRVLPPVLSDKAPPVERAMLEANVASNWELIKRLDPYVKSATGSLSELAEATRDALAQELPALVPHADQITRYLALYYGMQ